MRAARAASERYAGLQAAEHWRRALALWPPGVAEVNDPPTRRHEVVAGIAVQCDLSGRPRDAVPVLESELALPDPPHLYDIAERRPPPPVGPGSTPHSSWRRRRPAIIEQSINALPHAPPSHRGSLRRCTWQRHQDRVARSTHRGDRRLSAEAAPWPPRPVTASSNARSSPSGSGSSPHQDHARAVNEIERIIRTFAQTRPARNLYVAVRHTDILLMACRPADDVLRAARPSCSRPHSWRHHERAANMLMSNVAGWRAPGLVVRAMQHRGETAVAVPGPLPPPRSRHSRGDAEHEHGARRLVRLRRRSRTRSSTRPSSSRRHLSPRDLDGRSAEAPADAGGARRRRRSALPGTAGDSPGAHAAAAAAADAGPAQLKGRRQQPRRAPRAMHHDPFSPELVLADRACLPQWEAEKQRARGTLSRVS